MRPPDATCSIAVLGAGQIGPAIAPLLARNPGMRVTLADNDVAQLERIDAAVAKRRLDVADEVALTGFLRDFRRRRQRLSVLSQRAHRTRRAHHVDPLLRPDRRRHRDGPHPRAGPRRTVRVRSAMRARTRIHRHPRQHDGALVRAPAVDQDARRSVAPLSDQHAALQRDLVGRRSGERVLQSVRDDRRRHGAAGHAARGRRERADQRHALRSLQHVRRTGHADRDANGRVRDLILQDAALSGSRRDHAPAAARPEVRARPARTAPHPQPRGTVHAQGRRRRVRDRHRRTPRPGGRGERRATLFRRRYDQCDPADDRGRRVRDGRIVSGREFPQRGFVPQEAADFRDFLATPSGALFASEGTDDDLLGWAQSVPSTATVPV